MMSFLGLIKKCQESGINPSIGQCEINNYENASIARQKLQSVNPRKETVIKVEVENLVKA